MSRMPTILLGSVLLCLVAWTVLLLGESPLALQINADLVKLLGHPDSTANYARAIFMLLGVLVAAGVGGGIGWSLRAVSAGAREIELLSRLNATKGRIPRLESGMRSKEMQVERVEEQMHNLESLLPPLYKTIKERDQALRDREAMVLRLQQELSVWKRTPLVDEATARWMGMRRSMATARRGRSPAMPCSMRASAHSRATSASGKPVSRTSCGGSCSSNPRSMMRTSAAPITTANDSVKTSGSMCSTTNSRGRVRPMTG